tara:strand:+ start:327 stop:1067 length:741 start_codon:yes stop_codon:yes gene_type:complete
MNSTIIELKKVSYGNKKINILNDINLQIKENERIALIGKNGSGKSTLISILNGSLRPNKGQLKFYNQDYIDLHINQKRNIGTIWQDLRLIEELSVEQNVNCGLLGRENFLFALRNLLNLSNFKKAHKYLELCQLSESIYSKNLKQISGGQKQKVAIARGIAQEPKILFADEPFNNLDAKSINQILNLLVIKKNSSKIKLPSTVLISLHRIDLLNFFDRVIGIKNGKIFFDLEKSKLSKSKLIKIFC